MTTARVLIVEDDPVLQLALARELNRHAFDVETVASVDEALDSLSRRPAEVMLTDLRLGERDGLEALRMAREIAPLTRSILMSAYASAHDYQTAMDLGAVRVLCKPFSMGQLVAAVRTAIDAGDGFHGSFHGMSLVDFLQMMHLARRSAALHVGTGRPAIIQLVHGEVVHAEAEGTTGEEALRYILGLKTGVIRMQPVDDSTTSIARSFDALLLDALRILDERGLDAGPVVDRRLSQIPDDLFGPIPEIPRPSKVPQMPPLPAAPGDSRTMDLARRVWARACSALGSAGDGVLAVAVDLGSSAHTKLGSGSDELANELAAAVRGVGASAIAMCGADELVSDSIGAGLGFGLVWSSKRRLAIGLCDVAPTSSASMLFRALVTTTARCVLEEDVERD